MLEVCQTLMCHTSFTSEITAAVDACILTEGASAQSISATRVPIFLVKDKWKEQLTYHYGSLQVVRVELLNGEARVRKVFVSVMTVLTQGVEVDISTAFITVVTELITEHTDDQDQCNDGQNLLQHCDHIAMSQIKLALTIQAKV